MKPIRCGIALSVTIVVFYLLCFLIEAALPVQFLRFMNALFHGLDFGALVASKASGGADILYAVAVLATWGLAFGAFFAWLYNKISALQPHPPGRRNP